MIDPGLAYHYLLGEKEREGLMLRAQIRQLEARVGESTEADGTYWLQRTALLEHVQAAAEKAIRLEPGLIELAEAVEAVEHLAGPACRAGDHQVAAA